MHNSAKHMWPLELTVAKLPSPHVLGIFMLAPVDWVASAIATVWTGIGDKFLRAYLFEQCQHNPSLPCVYSAI